MDRPSHSVVQVLKLWNFSSELFAAKITRGREVSNEPDRTQLLSLLNFMCVPLKLKSPGDKANNCPSSTIKKFRLEFANMFKAITSSASTLRDYSKDKFIASIVSHIFTDGVKHLGPTISLQLADSILILPNFNQSGFRKCLQEVILLYILMFITQKDLSKNIKKLTTRCRAV